MSQVGERRVKLPVQLDRLGELKYSFQVYFKRNGNTMFLSQLAYSGRIPKHFRMEMAKIATSVMVDNVKELFLELVMSGTEHTRGNEFPNRSLIESFLYLSTHT